MLFSKIYSWFTKHKWQTVLIGFGLFFLPLIFVHISYRVTAVSEWFVSAWNPGELINYIAGFEAFVGTVFLGFVAVRQNDKANELNRRMIVSEERHRLFERQPSLMIAGASSSAILVPEVFLGEIPIFSFDDSFLGYYYDHEEFNLHLLKVTFTNASKVYAEFSVDRFLLSHHTKEKQEIIYSTMSTSTDKDRFHVLPSDEITLGFVVDDKLFENDEGMHANFGITMLNSIGEQYSEIIEFEITKYFTLIIDGYYISPLSNELD